MITTLKTRLAHLLGQRQASPFSAGGWAVTTYIITYALDALLFLPLNRLLKPATVGLYTEAVLVYAGVILIVQLSLVRALVRTPGDRPELAKATLWLSIIVGLGGGLLCGLAGLPIALFFNNSLLVVLLWLLAPGVLMAALGTVPIALLSRELDFRRRLLPETISVGIAAIVGLGAAIVGLGVYSLIIYSVLRVTVNTTVAWWIVWDRAEVLAIKEALASQGLLNFMRRPSRAVRMLLGFGVPAAGGELGLYTRFNIDYAIAGRQLGDDALGIYSYAWKTTDRPSRLINSFFDEVGYATFARLQAERDRLTEVFLSATRLFMVIAIPIFLGALFVRTELVAVLFSKDWQGVAEPLLPLFILQGLWLVFHPSTVLLLALGHSRVYAWVNGVALVGTGVAVLIGSGNGVMGVAWAMLLSSGLTSLTWGVLAYYYLRPTLAQLWRAIQLPLLVAVTTLPAIGLTSWLTATAKLPTIVRLAAALLVALVVFGLVVWRVWPALRTDLARLREKLPTEPLIDDPASPETIPATVEATR